MLCRERCFEKETLFIVEDKHYLLFCFEKETNSKKNFIFGKLSLAPHKRINPINFTYITLLFVFL